MNPQPESPTAERKTQKSKLQHDIERLSKGLPIHPAHRRIILSTYIRTLEKEIEIKAGALRILQKNVVRAVRRAERGLRTEANPLNDLKAVVEALPSLETLIGVVPLCDRCGKPAFKDCSPFCDVVLCKECSTVSPAEGSISSHPIQ